MSLLHALTAPYGRYRALGVLAVMTRSLSAARAPVYHRLLRRLGVLDQTPQEWPDADVLATMPWGQRQYHAPPPMRPQGIHGPWPQTPRVHAGFCAPVLDVPEREDRAHRDFNALRYLGQAAALWPLALWRARRGPRLERLDDQHFDALLQDTVYAQFIRAGVDDIDRDAFRPFLTASEDGLFTVDFSAVAGLPTLTADLHMAPTVVLMRREANAQRFRSLAIRVGDEVFTPAHGPRWILARYFVLMNAAMQVVLIWHPRLHFPHDTLNAVTRSLLPPEHPVRRLVTPHTWLTLGLHKAVIHHRRSVLHNSQREIYTPFAITTEGAHECVARGLAGIPGRRGYPEYRWGQDLPGVHTAYGRYRQQWFDAFFAMCRRALSEVSPSDSRVAEWAGHIADFVPGFPGADHIGDEDVLARTLATWMVGVSVFHSADHFSFGNISPSLAPLRLRTPPPCHQSSLREIEPESLVTPEDHLRRLIAHEMFFKPVVLRPLSTVRYGFDTACGRAAEEAFAAARRELDQRWSGHGLPTSQQVAVSIQY